jgi:hypothetical protein
VKYWFDQWFCAMLWASSAGRGRGKRFNLLGEEGQHIENHHDGLEITQVGIHEELLVESKASVRAFSSSRYRVYST